MFNKNVLAGMITIVCLTISMASACYSSPLRLMAMGDMQGIVEDDSDYLRDTTALAFLKNNQLTLSALSNSFSNSFDKSAVSSPQFDFSSRAYDWSGTRGLYDFSMNYKINDPLSMFVQYSDQDNNYKMSYLYNYDLDLDHHAYDVSVVRKGAMQTTSAGLSYKALDWLVLGVAYKQYYLSDRYNEDGEYNNTGAIPPIGTGTYSISYSKQSLTSMMLYDLRFFNKDAYLSWRYEGNIFNPSYSDSVAFDRYCVAGAYRIFSGMATLNAGYSRDFQYTKAFDDRSSVSLQMNPTKWITFGLGYVYDDSDSNAGHYTTSSQHFGTEYAINENLYLRGGAVIKEPPDCINTVPGSGPYSSTVNYHDYSLGIEYKLSNLSIELSYLNYQNIPDWADNWSAYTESPEITPANTSFLYVIPSDKRSEVVALGVNYMF
jgi:hypothetical protein